LNQVGYVVNPGLIQVVAFHGYLSPLGLALLGTAFDAGVFIPLHDRRPFAGSQEQPSEGRSDLASGGSL